MLIAALGLTGGLVFAQAGGDATPVAPDADLETEVDLEVLDDQAIQQLSSQELTNNSQQRIAKMRDILDDIQALLEEAREQDQDIQKLNCINEKLVAIKGFLKVSEQSYVQLTEAIKRNDRPAAVHHYKLIAISEQRIDALAEEARLCVGEEVLYEGGPQIEKNIPETGTPDTFVDTPGFPSDFIFPTSPTDTTLPDEQIFTPPPLDPMTEVQ